MRILWYNNLEGYYIYWEGVSGIAVSEKKKASNAKWDSINMATLGCRVKKDQAEAFKVYCEMRGQTSNAVLRDYVLGCIGQGNTPESPQEDAGTQSGPGGIPVSLDTLKAAQRAAGATGESVPDFVSRAVIIQEKRDRVSIMAGINPAAEEKAKGEE